MDRVVYTAASGASRVLEHQGIVSNNMANVSTAGFREELAMYRAVPLQGHNSLPTRVSTATASSASNYQQGGLAETGHVLDLAIRGEGWFAVQTPDGEAYTRAGEFAVNAESVLVTQSGLPVLSEDNAPIEIPERGTMTFSDDGQITVIGAGDNPNDIQNIGIVKMVNPPVENLVRGEDGLFRLADGTAAPADEQVRMVSGFVERSNVNPAEAMVTMIANARLFEMQMKVIQEAKTNAERANGILSAQ
ncbi:flagellar basal-body rod protein FlgF [Achromobacter sp. F4_2707]|uniref:flagellar basal-body rod protein FlgF n=1 Tax=Achromobacter sp. F4_2707 TaxID=3114286 RepID=UPI0039C6C37E